MEPLQYTCAVFAVGFIAWIASRHETIIETRPPAPRNPTRVIAMKRGRETFILTFDDLSRAERELERMAQDPKLSFTWQDAAQCACAARALMNNPNGREQEARA